MHFRAEHRSQRLPLHLLQHAQCPHHIHQQGRVQAPQLGPQLLVNLDRGGAGRLCSAAAYLLGWRQSQRWNGLAALRLEQLLGAILADVLGKAWSPPFPQ